MAKTKFFDWKNVVRSIKGIGVSIVTSVVVLMPMFMARWLLINMNMLFLGLVVGVSTLGLYLLTWGYLANKFWGWK